MSAGEEAAPRGGRDRPWAVDGRDPLLVYLTGGLMPMNPRGDGRAALQRTFYMKTVSTHIFNFIFYFHFDFQFLFFIHVFILF